MDLKSFRLENDIPIKNVVWALKRKYPRYSKITQSMVENPDKYGVKLVPEAEAMLEEVFVGGRTEDRHRNKCRLTCRLSDARYEEVKQALERDGRFSSTQAWLEWWVSVWLNGQKKAALRGANTEDGGMGNQSMHKVTQERGDVNGGAS